MRRIATRFVVSVTVGVILAVLSYVAARSGL